MLTRLAVTWALAGSMAALPDEAVTVLAAGDVTLGHNYQTYVDGLVADGGSVTWGFEEVKALTSAADVFVVNLECPFTDRGDKLPKNFNFRARPELVAALVAGGVDVVSLANNHLMDYGRVGLLDTVATLQDAGIASFGAGPSLARARAPAVVTVKGVRIAFLGYFFLGTRNIEPREVIATRTTPGVAGHFSDEAEMVKMVVADVKAARKVAEHVIPFFHWGIESTTTPQPYQVALAHAAIDAGASAVLGSHPHVLQGLELYRDRPVVYSLGNFVFGGNWNPKDKRSGLVELTLDGPRVSARFIPAFSDAYPERPMQPYLAEGEAAEGILRHLREISAGFPRPLME